MAFLHHTCGENPQPCAAAIFTKYVVFSKDEPRSQLLVFSPSLQGLYFSIPKTVTDVHVQNLSYKSTK